METNYLHWKHVLTLKFCREGVHGHIEIDIWKVGVDVLGEFKERLTRLGEGDWSLRVCFLEMKTIKKAKRKTTKLVLEEL